MMSHAAHRFAPLASMTDDALDPSAPLRTIDGVTIRQRVGGSLYVLWGDGREEDFPAGYSVAHVEAEVRRRLSEARQP